MAKNPRLVDISGKTFGRWTVFTQDGNAPGGGAMWQCACSCGTKRRVLGSDLRAGKSVSCGCATTERAATLRLSHGGTGTRLHRIWKNMRARCLRPMHPGYADYGGRGITICLEWADFAEFRDWAMSSGYKDTLSIERLDVNGGYSPDNCTWAMPAAQSANRRFVALAPDGELWWHKAKANGINAAAYRSRLYDGWPIEDAATRPMRGTRTS